MKQKMKKLIGYVLVVSLLAGIMMVSSAAPATPEETGNLIKASNFYAGSVGTANAPWIMSANSTNSNIVSYEECNIPAIGPTRVLETTIDSTDTNTLPFVLDQAISPDVHGGVYELSYWLKIDGTGGKFQPYYTTVGEFEIADAVTDTGTESDGWMKFTYTFVVRKYSTGSADFKVRFKMSDPNEGTVTYMLTDVQLKRTNQQFVPRNSLWSTAGNGNTATWSDGGAVIVTKSDSGFLPSASFSNDLQAGKEYLITFKLSVEDSGELSVKTEGIITGTTRFMLFDRTNNKAMARITESTDGEQEFSFRYTPTNAVSSMGIYFARPSETGVTITYNLSELSITEYVEPEEDTSIVELVPETQKNKTITLASSSSSMGLISITNYNISFHVKIEGNSEVNNTNSWFGTNRIAFMQTGFNNGTAILKTFNADSSGQDFSLTFTPTGTATNAGTFRLYFDKPASEQDDLTYTLSNFSITYKKQDTEITEAVISNVDLESDEPTRELFTGTSETEAYTLIERWERVNDGRFATSNDEINTALGDAGTFTVFASGAWYRYSLVLIPNDGYCIAEGTTLTVNGVEIEADFSYGEADGTVIITPRDKTIFVTVMGDANMDGYADVRDLVRMVKYVAGDTTAEVYEKKCNFDETTDGITAEDIGGLRDFLVNPQVK